MKLTQIQKDAMKLLLRSKDIGGGWRQCNPEIFKIFVAKVPEALVERDSELSRLRLTTEGQAVSKWL